MTAIAVGVSIAIIWVGMPLVAATMMAWRWGARMERRWVGIALGDAIADPHRPLPDGTRRKRWGVIVHDPATWKDLPTSCSCSRWASLWFVIVVTLWAWRAVACCAAGLVLDAARRPGARSSPPTATTRLSSSTPLGSALWPRWWASLLVPVAASGRAGVGALHGVPRARSLLGAGRGQLEARVTQLADARGRAVDHAAAERRRIERDLHDGAQQRLVALAMGLGLAREKLDSDPAAAGVLVAEAHEEAKRALADLRDLARGIHPAILTEQGLDPALSALAARSPVPVEVDVVGSAACRAAHRGRRVLHRGRGPRQRRQARQRDSRAARARVPPRTACWWWRSRTTARAAPTRTATGCSGLADRATAVEGRVAVSSPSGGPTIDPRGASVRVLIAEDSLLLRVGLERLLADRGFEVVGRGADAEALLDAVDEHAAGHLRSSTSACRRRTPTRACARRSSCASATPTWPSSCSRQIVEERYATRLLRARRARASATC